jgi:membrane fusion protein (multidrug efflux system)
MADGSSPAPVRRAVTLTPEQSRHRRSQMLRLPLLILGPVLVLAGGLYFYLSGGRYVGTDNAYVRADMLAVSTDVSGIVASVEVTDNQHIDAGQVLFRLDDAPFRFALDNARAQLALARTQVEAMKADWREKQQEQRLAQINLDFAQRDWKRRNELFDQHVIPVNQMDQAQQTRDAATQQIQTILQQEAGIVANLGGDADLPTAQHPRVQAAQALLDQAARDLERTVVKAPRAGIVTQVPNLQPGMYLRAATPSLSIVASDQPWIEANPKETQLTYIQPGQKVTITVDAFPGSEWTGTVASISPASGAEFSLLPAQNTSGNWVKVDQRIPLRVSVDPDPAKPLLRAGMSTVIEIDTGHRRTFHSLLAGLGLVRD